MQSAMTPTFKIPTAQFRSATIILSISTAYQTILKLTKQTWQYLMKARFTRISAASFPIRHTFLITLALALSETPWVLLTTQPDMTIQEHILTCILQMTPMKGDIWDFLTPPSEVRVPSRTSHTVANLGDQLSAPPTQRTVLQMPLTATTTTPPAATQFQTLSASVEQRSSVDTPVRPVVMDTPPMASLDQIASPENSLQFTKSGQRLLMDRFLSPTVLRITLTATMQKVPLLMAKPRMNVGRMITISIAHQ